MRRRLRSQSGFTLIEMLVACTITTIGVMAVLTTFDSSRSLVSQAERKEAAIHQAERELERIKSLPYAKVALTSAPVPSESPRDPRYWVQPDGTYRFDHKVGGRQEPLDVQPGVGGIATKLDWTDGRVTGELHTFVTKMANADLDGAPGQSYPKRVTVAVRVDGRDAPRIPVVVSGLLYDRDPAPAGAP